MRLYLVRHGQTTQNALFTTQCKDDELSSEGIEQAKSVAKRFEGVTIDLIFSSSFPRAAETAMVIGDVVGKGVEHSELLCELKKPSEIEGTTIESEKNIQIKALLREHLYDENWHYSDEENFFDFKKRVKVFAEMISQLQVESVAVVTHGATMVMLMLLLQFGEDLKPEQYQAAMSFYWINNTGITLLDNSWDGKWWLISWNDHGHLGYFYK